MHRSYVLVSADKSENNTIVVCKRYYVERLRQELAAEGTDKSTYRRQTESAEEVIKKQVEEVGSVKKKKHTERYLCFTGSLRCITTRRDADL